MNVYLEERSRLGSLGATGTLERSVRPEGVFTVIEGVGEADRVLSSGASGVTVSRRGRLLASEEGEEELTLSLASISCFSTSSKVGISTATS